MADISLVIDRSKNVFALAPLNAMSKKWVEQNKSNLNLVNVEGMMVTDESTLLDKLKFIMDNDYSIEVWNKRDLTKDTLPATPGEL